ncbi:MAG: hypothetical protein LAP40_28490 [Acidobacteriia bacterium]|nr:hypothetical protein [Terriglobia bacterium]
MGSPYPAAALVTLALATAACRTAAPRPAIAAELAACVPSDTRVLAGVHLDTLRANPGFQHLSRGWAGLLEPVRDASEVLVAYNGRELLVIARGQFRSAPAGARLLTPQLAVAGGDAAVRAATAQRATGRSGAPALVALADAVAAQSVWAVESGGGSLPLRGNSVNLNRLLAFTDHATFAAELNSAVTLHAAGICRSANAARHLEETLRGLLSIAAATVRDRDLAAWLAAVQVHRDELTVRADVSGSVEAVTKLFSLAAR